MRPVEEGAGEVEGDADAVVGCVEAVGGGGAADEEGFEGGAVCVAAHDSHAFSVAPGRNEGRMYEYFRKKKERRRDARVRTNQYRRSFSESS